MEHSFEEPLFREIHLDSRSDNKVYKANQAEIAGNVRISIEEDSHDGIKIVLKKDSNEVVKEIKFICSCGQTKSIILDYAEQ